MFRITLLVITTLMDGCIGGQSLWAGDVEDDSAVSALKAVNDIAWSKMVVKVVDADGKPVEGAVVRPWALQAGNGGGLWTDAAYGAPKRTRTDAEGQTEVVFPQASKWGDSPVVVSVSVFVSHGEFCTKSAHVDVPKGEPPHVPTVTLERGVRLRIAGVEPGSDRPLSHCHVLLEGTETDEPEFVTEPDGWVRSIPIHENRRWFRVVRVPPGEPPQFSKALAWTPDDPGSREVRAEVRPGVRVLGKVSDEVPRPIVRGHVVAWCGSPARREEAGGERVKTEPIWWIETVPIREDGSFEFPSLPSGYLAQIYAWANDSISSQPTDEAYKICCDWFAADDHERQRSQVFRYGQVLRLVGTKSQITLNMEPAGQVRVKCVDAAGRPLPRVHVGAGPNQYMVGCGSTYFCTRQSSLDGLKGKLYRDWLNDNPFSAETDANGEALIRNLPSGHQSFHAGSHLWMSKQEHGAEAKAGETVEVTVVLEKVK